MRTNRHVLVLPLALVCIAGCLGAPPQVGNACRLPPARTPAASGTWGAQTVAVPAGCTVVLGPGDDGRHLSVAGGTTIVVNLSGWQYSPPSSVDGSGEPSGVLRMVSHTGKSATFVAGTAGSASISSANTGRWSAADPATVWSVGIEVGGIHLIQPLFTSSTVGWAQPAASPDVLRSADGGLHWRDVTPHGTSVARPADGGPIVWRYDFVSDDVAWTAVGDASGTRTYRTIDGGRTWTSGPVVDPGPPLSDLFALDAGDGWVLVASVEGPRRPPGPLAIADGRR